jgi:large subunit ribosomal protein L32e
MNKDTLQQRKEIKDRKPNFSRQETNKKDKFEGQWRRPRGSQSKMRKNRKGHRDMPSIGYGSPRGVEGLLKDGSKPNYVSSIKDLENVTEGVLIISGTVGAAKKIKMLALAKEKKLKVFNVKDVDAYLKKIADKKEAKKKQAEKKKSIRQKAKEESVKKAEDQKKTEEAAENKDVKTETPKAETKETVKAEKKEPVKKAAVKEKVTKEVKTEDKK